MPGVRRVKGEESETLERSADKNAGRAPLSKTKTRPGLVQNWPPPRVKEACRSAASSSGGADIAPGKMNRGLVLDISAKNGIGSGRLTARLKRARAARCEPVKAGALARGCGTGRGAPVAPES